MKETNRLSLENAVKKTMSAVTREVMQVSTEHEDRLSLLKKNLGKVVSLKVHEIEREENVRKGVISEGEEFQKLVESIRQFGLLQPIVVELRVKDLEFSIVCVAGHRRLSAARALGQERIFCLLQSYEEKSQRTGAALSENLNREQLHFLDTSEGYLDLLEQGWTEDRIASHFERDPKTIKRYLTMARWPAAVRNLLRAHRTIFSLRKVLHSFVQRSFSSDTALLFAIQEEIRASTYPAEKTRKIGASANPNPYHVQLDEYFSTRSTVPMEVRIEVENVLKYLKLMK